MSSGGQGLGILLSLRLGPPDLSTLMSAPQTRVNFAPLRFDTFVERNFLPESSGNGSGKMFLPPAAALALRGLFEGDLLVGTFAAPMVFTTRNGKAVLHKDQ